MAKEILIADSDKTDQKEFQRIFETTDYHLIFSESGEDALLRARLFKPDMIIASGAGLQEKGGLEFCGAIKGDPEFKHIPFILISSIFDEVSEKDRERYQADGVISKPLNEGEVLDLVDNLMGEEAGKKGKMVSEKQELSSDGTEEEEEEIIDLVDVVGEPEARMSIDSFVPTGREKSFGEEASLDSWGKLGFEEKPMERELEPRPEKKIRGTDFQLKRKVPLKEASPEEDLFDKIELEEILEKVEQLKPSLEKEWPSEKEARDIEESPFQIEEPAEKLDLSEFEKSLRREVKAGLPREKPEPFFAEKPKERILEETISKEERVEKGIKESFEESLEEPLEAEEFKELREEEFPEELLEEALGEKEIGAIGGQEELKDEELIFEELKVEDIDEMEEIEKMEEVEEIGGLEPTDQIEEMEQAEEIEEIKMDRLEEAATPKTSRVETPKIPREEVPSLVRAVDKQMQEVISQKVQEIMGEMMTKLVPQMTQNVVGFTLERIEKIVKEVVPDLAEKAIQEEIKRLEKGEKG